MRFRSLHLQFGDYCSIERLTCMGRHTTPPPPNKELLAAFTIEVVASLVIEARINEVFELHNEDGAGREPVGGAGWSCPSLYRSAMVGIEDSWTGEDIFCWGRVSNTAQFVCH